MLQYTAVGIQNESHMATSRDDYWTDLKNLAGSIEYITAQIDMRTRRMAAFPEPLSSGLERLHQKHQALSWPAPLCGSLKL